MTTTEQGKRVVAMTTMEQGKRVRERAEELGWYHTLELLPGYTTRGMFDLRETEGGHRLVGDEPNRRRHDRVEQRGEVDADTADHGPAVLGEAPRERRVDVLVR